MVAKISTGNVRPVLQNVRLVLLPQFLSHRSKKLKWQTRYKSSRQDLWGKYQAVHSWRYESGQVPIGMVLSHFGFPLLYPLFPLLSRFLGPDWLQPLQQRTVPGYTQDQPGKGAYFPTRGSHSSPWLFVGFFFFFPSHGFLWPPSWTLFPYYKCLTFPFSRDRRPSSLGIGVSKSLWLLPAELGLRGVLGSLVIFRPQGP